MPLRSFAAVLLIVTGIFCLNLQNTFAQDSTSHATLMKWDEDIRNFILDRSHNYGGTHFNRGLFREHINEMSPEYNIDMMIYRYTIIDDYRWEMAQLNTPDPT